MRIIIAADIFPPDIGGPAIYSKNLAKALVKKGHKVLVICYGSNNEKNEIDDFEIIKINRNRTVFFRYLNYFLTILKAGKNFDLIFAQGPVSSGFPTMFATKILRKKFIVKIVGDHAWEQSRNRFKIKDGIDEFQNKKYLSSTFKNATQLYCWDSRRKVLGSFKIEIFRFIQKLVVKNAKKIITPSYYLRDLVKGWGAEEKNIEVIYNSVNLDNIFVMDKNSAQDKIGIKGRIIFSVARLVPWKGFEMLIKIWQDILKKETNLKLVIAGDGPEKEKLEKLIKDNNLEKNVFLIGRIAHKDLIYYFNASEIFVLNSGYEGLSHVLIEAMACGLPIIASNKGGNKEVIKNMYNGMLVEYNNSEKWEQAILKLLNDEDLRQKFINNSARDFKKFEYSTMINKTEKILKKLLS